MLRESLKDSPKSAGNYLKTFRHRLWTPSSVQRLGSTRSNPINQCSALVWRRRLADFQSAVEIFPLCCAAHMAGCSCRCLACKNSLSTVHFCCPAAFPCKETSNIYRLEVYIRLDFKGQSWRGKMVQWPFRHKILQLSLSLRALCRKGTDA